MKECSDGYIAVFREVMAPLVRTQTVFCCFVTNSCERHPSHVCGGRLESREFRLLSRSYVVACMHVRVTVAESLQLRVTNQTQSEASTPKIMFLFIAYLKLGQT